MTTHPTPTPLPKFTPQKQVLLPPVTMTLTLPATLHADLAHAAAKADIGVEELVAQFLAFATAHGIIESRRGKNEEPHQRGFVHENRRPPNSRRPLRQPRAADPS